SPRCRQWAQYRRWASFLPFSGVGGRGGGGAVNESGQGRLFGEVRFGGDHLVETAVGAQLAVAHEADGVAVADGGQAVGHHHDGHFSGQIGDRSGHGGFGGGVQGRGGLIHHQ